MVAKFKDIDSTKLHYQTHELFLRRQASSLTIEFYPSDIPKNDFVLLLSHERMPMYFKFDLAVMANENYLEWRFEEGIRLLACSTSFFERFFFI